MLAASHKALAAALLWLTWLAATCSGQAALAQELQPIPPLTARVVDLTERMSQGGPDWYAR